MEYEKTGMQNLDFAKQAENDGDALLNGMKEEIKKLGVTQLSDLMRSVLETLCNKLRAEEGFADKVIIGGTITSSGGDVRLTSCDIKTSPYPVYTPVITIY